MSRDYVDLHCGACMEKFGDNVSLSIHLESCMAAEAMLPSIQKLFFLGDRRVGHPMGNLIGCIHKNIHLIQRYAYCIADEMDSLNRAKLHDELCDKLWLDHKEFRPFESSEIKKLPDRDEAEKILWAALRDELFSLW